MTTFGSGLPLAVHWILSSSPSLILSSSTGGVIVMIGANCTSMDADSEVEPAVFSALHSYSPASSRVTSRNL